MTTSATTVRLIGLDELDKHELEDVGQGGVQFSKVEIPGGAYGEPGTIIAIVIITVAALKSVTAWLMKKRRQGTVELISEIEHIDGRKERKIVRIDVSSSDPGRVLEQLGAAFEVDPKLLAQAIGS